MEGKHFPGPLNHIQARFEKMRRHLQGKGAGDADFTEDSQPKFAAWALNVMIRGRKLSISGIPTLRRERILKAGSNCRGASPGLQGQPSKMDPSRRCSGPLRFSSGRHIVCIHGRTHNKEIRLPRTDRSGPYHPVERIDRVFYAYTLGTPGSMRYSFP